MHSFLEFEKSVANLEGKVQELRAMSDNSQESAVDVADEIDKLEKKG